MSPAISWRQRPRTKRCRGRRCHDGWVGSSRVELLTSSRSLLPRRVSEAVGGIDVLRGRGCKRARGNHALTWHSILAIIMIILHIMINDRLGLVFVLCGPHCVDIPSYRHGKPYLVLFPCESTLTFFSLAVRSSPEAFFLFVSHKTSSEAWFKPNLTSAGKKSMAMTRR